jgi:lipopolysaccharide biosynthesis regulator YciM/2-polyprenyl-3-methyl-5-hydroxy-6-metoxy-1,4-benzoquinol methylase
MSKYLRSITNRHRLNLAEERLNAGDLEAAEDLLGQVLVSDPADLTALTQLAEIAALQGDWPLAVERWERVGAESEAAGKPASKHVLKSLAGARLNLAEERLNAGELKVAESLLGQVLADAPEDLGALTQLAGISTLRGDWPAAVQRWECVGELYNSAGKPVPERASKRLSNARVKLAAERLNAGETDVAEALLGRVLAVAPEDLGARAQLAEISILRGDWAAAVERWESLLNFHGDNAPSKVYLRLGFAYRNQGDLDAADNVVKRGIKNHSNNVKLASEFAEIATARKDWPEAIKRWRSLLELDDSQAKWHYRLGFAYEKVKNWELAAAAYQEAIARDNSKENWRERLNFVLDEERFNSIVNFWLLPPTETKCPVCNRHASFFAAPYPANPKREPVFSRAVVIFCNSCGSGYIPEAEKILRNYYENEYGISNKKDREIDPEEYFSANAKVKFPSLKTYFNRAQAQFNSLEQYGAKFKKVLDYGSGPGYFLYICDAKYPFAVELDSHCEKYLKYINAKKIEPSGLPQHFFDVIVASHVVEHFTDKTARIIITSMLKALKPEGLLLIEVPQGGHSFLKLKNKQAPHTIFFTPEGIKLLVQTAGGEIKAAYSRDKVEYKENENSIYQPFPNDEFLSAKTDGLTLIIRPGK